MVMMALVFVYKIFNRICYKYRLLKTQLYNIHPYIVVGKRTYIESTATLKIKNGGTITIGNNVVISSGVQIITWGADVIIEDNTQINPYTVIHGGVKIGQNVMIAAHCGIFPANHIFSDTSKPMLMQGLSRKGIVVEDNCWLGCGVKILDGVSVKYGSVIGANSVVVKNTVKNSVWVGSPAVKIKDIV